MSEPTTQEILDVWFDDGRVPLHRKERQYWRDSAGATMVMLCDRLDQKDNRIAELEAENKELREACEEVVANRAAFAKTYCGIGYLVDVCETALVTNTPPLTDAELASEIAGSEP